MGGCGRDFGEGFPYDCNEMHSPPQVKSHIHKHIGIDSLMVSGSLDSLMLKMLALQWQKYVFDSLLLKTLSRNVCSSSAVRAMLPFI